MSSFHFLLLFVLPSLVLSRDAKPSKYIIDLDLQPEERWAKVASDHADDFRKLLLQIEGMLPKELVLAVSDLAGNLDKYFPYPYADELRGIVKYGGNVTLGQTILGNLLYDLTAFRKIDHNRRGACTSIVASDKNGNIIHGRNLDYALSNTLRDMTIEVQFKNKRNPNIFTGTTFAGFVGVLTGARPGGISISLDERDVGEWWENVISALKQGSHGIVSLLIRDVLQSDEDMNFATAVEQLSSTPLISPCYLIVGGQLYTEGVVITRDRTAALDKWYIHPDKHQWYVLETNYDHWNSPPSDDNRRDPGIKAMDAVGRDDISYDTLFQVLSTDPVLNNGTTYTTIMSPSRESWFFNTTIRYP